MKETFQKQFCFKPKIHLQSNFVCLLTFVFVLHDFVCRCQCFTSVIYWFILAKMTMKQKDHLKSGFITTWSIAVVWSGFCPLLCVYVAHIFHYVLCTLPCTVQTCYYVVSTLSSAHITHCILLKIWELFFMWFFDFSLIITGFPLCTLHFTFCGFSF